MVAFVKDEATGRRNKRYFIYTRTRDGWTNFTGLRFDDRRRAERLARAINKELAGVAWATLA